MYFFCDGLNSERSSGFINQYTTPGYFEWCTCGIFSLAFQRNSVLHFSQEPQRPGPRIPWQPTLSWRLPPPPSTTTRRSSSTPRWLKSRYGLVVIFYTYYRTRAKHSDTTVTMVTPCHMGVFREPLVLGFVNHIGQCSLVHHRFCDHLSMQNWVLCEAIFSVVYILNTCRADGYDLLDLTWFPQHNLYLRWKST